MSNPAYMNRSRNQIATSYAPGSFFTFEGGVGACIATPVTGDPANLGDTTTRRILERLEQFASAWYERALSARSGNDEQAKKFPIVPQLCVDPGLLDDEGSSVRLPGREILYFSKPSHMGYTPAPLTFTCRYCSLFKEFSGLKDMARELPTMQAAVCPSPKSPAGKCSWEQLDVIFVHWSGGWSAASPSMWNFRDGTARLDRASCGACGGREFKLNRASPKIGDWYFYCAKAGCGVQKADRWLQRDKDTLEILRTTVGTGRLSGPTEVNMEATPYRANNAYHVQADLFIDFQKNDTELTRLLAKDAEDDLRAFIAGAYGFEVSPITDADVEAACAGHPELQEQLALFRNTNASIAQLESLLATANEAMTSSLRPILDTARSSKRQLILELREKQVVTSTASLPSAIDQALTMRRQLFDGRYDPFQLAIEHKLLSQARLTIPGEYVSFKKLDKDLSPETDEEKERLEGAAHVQLSALGIADMGLIRKFDLCRFSFGYSRISSQPVIPDKRHMSMPVRLRLFDRVLDDDRRKYPIYVVQQANQAIYVRLDAERVMGWLATLGCSDPIELAEGQKPGAGIFAHTQPMRRFLDGLPELPNSYFYLYTLLHSYAHHLIRQVSSYSGLDIGSIGEYLFPADLAFVIYRNGTTMDLGNLSAMWRNSGTALLDSLLDPRSLQCGTGSLCTSRGSACPDCQMIPEVSCLANNRLLSRSVLRSIGGRPHFDRRGGGIPGYLDLASMDHA